VHRIASKDLKRAAAEAREMFETASRPSLPTMLRLSARQLCRLRTCRRTLALTKRLFSFLTHQN
jgi:hypothetical protein